MLIAKHVIRLDPYVPGEQPKAKRVIKLNTNENPYPPSPKCGDVLKGFDLDRLRKYPDPLFEALRLRIAKIWHTTPDRVFVGNGSDEVLTLCARAFVEDDEAIGSLDPSYSLYKTLAAIRDVPWRGVPLGADFALPKDFAPHLASAAAPVSLFLWTNPNAPTSTFAPRARIAAFAKKFPGVVLVDEAYADFADDNCVPLATAPRNRNVIVMRTMSKSFSLAGLRLGYCIGPANLIEALYKVKDSYNADAVAQAVALAALNDLPYMRRNAARVRRTRTRLARTLRARGWDVPESQSNFLFARPPVAAGESPFACAERLFTVLKERHIYVRYFRGPKTGDRLRITIGTDAETDALLAALAALGC